MTTTLYIHQHEDVPTLSPRWDDRGDVVGVLTITVSSEGLAIDVNTLAGDLTGPVNVVVR